MTEDQTRAILRKISNAFSNTIAGGIRPSDEKFEYLVNEY
jgi:hypothetical protein